MGRGVINLTGVCFKSFGVALFKVFGAIAKLMNPAALMLGVRIDEINGIDEAFRAVGNNELKVLPSRPRLSKSFKKPSQALFDSAGAILKAMSSFLPKTVMP